MIDDPDTRFGDPARANALRFETSRANANLIQLLTLYKLDRQQLAVDVMERNVDEFLEEITAAHRALMQSINTIRLVLGTMLGITDDESADAADTADTPEHHLYDFLSWLLEWTVRSLSAD